jgi:predicted ATPase
MSAGRDEAWTFIAELNDQLYRGPAMSREGESMISILTLQNFKNLRAITVDLEPLTVFVGANGSGKTSVLDAVNYASLAATGAPEKVFTGNRHCDWLYTRGGQGELSIYCGTHDGSFEVKASPPAIFPPKSELFGRSGWTFAVDFSDVDARQEFSRPERSVISLKLDPVQLAKPSYSDHNPPRVGFDGRNLPSVLAYMALNDPDTFNELLSRMRSMIPALKRIRFKKAQITRTEKEYIRVDSESIERRIKRVFQGDAMLFDFVHAENLAAHTISEGTLMLLGLLTVLMSPPRPEILLMDDIERGLHPLAQKTLIGILEQIVNSSPTAQIIATAHSPYLLNYLTPEQVRIMAAGPDGYARCGKLAEHPKFATWEKEMAPGEMWSLFGEKWLADKGAEP